MTEGPDAHDVIFARHMLQAREVFGWSQAELSRRCRDLGQLQLHPTTIGRIENFEREVKLGEAKTIAQAFGMEIEDLMAPRPERFDAALQFAHLVHRWADRLRATHEAAAECRQVLADMQQLLDSDTGGLRRAQRAGLENVLTRGEGWISEAAKGTSSGEHPEEA